jgi:hypothetical protein
LSFSGFDTVRIGETLAPSHGADAISVEDGDNQEAVQTTLVPASVPARDRHEIRKIGTG